MPIRSFLILIASTLAIMFTSTACLEVTTETTINADGSGSQSITMDMSQMVEKMGSMMFDGEEPSHELFAEKMGADLTKSMDSIRMAVDTIEGIHDFAYRLDGYGIVYELKFDHVNDLKNFEAVNTANEGMGGGTNNLSLATKGSKSTISWSLDTDKLKESMGESEEEREQVMVMMRSMLEGMKATTIYNLPGKVKKVSDKDNMEVGKNKRTVVYSVPLLDLFDGKVAQDAFITYKQPK